MSLLIAIFVLSILVSIGLGALAHARAWSVLGGPMAWGAAAGRRFGPIPGAVVVFVIGWVAMIVVSLGLGFLAKAIENSVDKPTFHWVFPRTVTNTSEFTVLNNKLTFMGNNGIVQVVLIFAVIVLACAYRRRWWIPVLILALAYFGEHYSQLFLAHVVDRGHPPTTRGTFPSGGVGRLISIYGTIIVLIIQLIPSLSRTWRNGLWTGLMTAGVVEAFTRVYLSKHWLTDAVLALPFGVLLLLTQLAGFAALVHVDAAAEPTEGAAGRHLAASDV